MMETMIERQEEANMPLHEMGATETSSVDTETTAVTPTTALQAYQNHPNSGSGGYRDPSTNRLQYRSLSR